MNIKHNCWILLFVVLTCICGNAAAPIVGEARMIGVPSFGTGTTIANPWKTDVNTTSTRSWFPLCCSPLDGAEKYVSTQLGSLRGPSSSSIWIDVPNHFYASGLPMPHSLRFRWEASLDGNNYIVCTVNDINVTNALFLSNWTDVNLYINPLPGATLRLKWTVVDLNTTFGFDSANLDAVRWVPINTNTAQFTISKATSNTFLLSWATNYIGYTLNSKTTLTNAWQADPAPVVLTNNLYRATVTNVPVVPRKFYRLRVP